MPKQNSSISDAYKLIILGVLIIVCTIVIAHINPVRIIYPGQVGIKSTLGTIKAESLLPGVHLQIPFLDSISTLSNRTISLPEEFGSLTRDSQTIKVTGNALYALNADRAPEVFSKIGTTDEALSKSVVQPTIIGSVKTVISRYSMSEIIDNQEKISLEIEEVINTRLKLNHYVTFERFTVTGFVLDKKVQEAIESKQIANQELQRAATQVEIAKKQAEAKKALTGSITPLTLMQDAIDKWDGSGIPPTTGNSQFLIQPQK